MKRCPGVRGREFFGSVVKLWKMHNRCMKVEKRFVALIYREMSTTKSVMLSCGRCLRKMLTDIRARLLRRAAQRHSASYAGPVIGAWCFAVTQMQRTNQIKAGPRKAVATTAPFLSNQATRNPSLRMDWSLESTSSVSPSLPARSGHRISSAMPRDTRPSA